MNVKRVISNPNVTEHKNKRAFEYDPLVYAVENNTLKVIPYYA